MSLTVSFVLLLQASAASTNWQEALASYRDPRFDGSLAPEAVALSENIGDSLRPVLAGEAHACAKPDALAGELVATGDEEKIQSQADEIPEAFAPLVKALDSRNPETVAIAEHAIGLLGPRARFLAPRLKRNGMPRDAWASEALSSITCDRWTTSGLVFAGLPDPERSCEAAPGFYAKLAEGATRRWPARALETEWAEISSACKDSGSIPPPDEIAIDRLASLLAGQEHDAKQLVETLHVFEDIGPALKPLAPLIERHAASIDPQVQWSAQRALVASGDAGGIGVLEKMLDDPDAWGLTWRDLILNQRANAVELRPLLVRTLHHPMWNNRVEAAYAIAEFDLVDAVPDLVGAVESKDWLTTEAVVQALGHFVDRSPQARDALERISGSYWSGKVRDEARNALLGPRTAHDGLDRIGCLGACPVDHKQRMCAKDGFSSGRYRMASGGIVDIDWRKEERHPFPRGEITRLSSWCEIGTTATRRVAGGWLVGCSGVESDGALGFLADGAEQPQAFARMGVDFIVPLGARTLVAASSPFEAGEAGAVFTVDRATDASWKLDLFSLLPSVPDAYAPVGSGIAFRDGLNAVFMADDGAISTLDCVDDGVR